MAARQGLLEDLMEFGLRVQPRVGVALAALSWMILHVVTSVTMATGKASIGNLGAAITQSSIHIGAAILQYVVPFCLLIGVLVSILSRRRAMGLLDRARINPKSAIASMTWRDFERVIGAAFRQQGFTVTELGGNGPDGGIDLALTKDGRRQLVQCKHWKEWKVGVAVVRELMGVMSAQNAVGGYVITSGQFTREAKDFARDTGITLIDGPALGELIGATSFEPAVSRAKILQPRPACPKCGGTMVERMATRGQFVGKPFWGCQKYPSCAGIVQIS